MTANTTAQRPSSPPKPTNGQRARRPGDRPRPRPSARIGPGSRVLALVPHYRCERWLPAALESLMEQTVPLDGIAVIDDGSNLPPMGLTERFPRVTLLHAEKNVGPYALVQAVIDRTGYDAYLFNDADDWSAPTRLERLLDAAWEHGAELVGSQEVRVDCREGEAYAVPYPLDVNEALSEEPTAFPLLHPTSLVGRALVRRVGGFASGMRFSGDAEFLRRAVHAARVVNVPDYLYFRRKRAGALTTSPKTGLDSRARRRVQAALWERARENARRVGLGRRPELRPLTVAPPAELRHLGGPRLRSAPGREATADAVGADFHPRWTRDTAERRRHDAGAS